MRTTVQQALQRHREDLSFAQAVRRHALRYNWDAYADLLCGLASDDKP